MVHRPVCDSVLAVHPSLMGQSLASPSRRLCAFLIDFVILVIPSIAFAVAAAVLSISLTDPAALRAIKTTMAARSFDTVEARQELGTLAPLLVRIQAPGLPPAVAIAVAQSDLQRAGELLADYKFEFALYLFQDPPPPRPHHIRINVDRLVPKEFRAVALFGIAALYFTFFTAKKRTATPGKWLMGIRVLKLDGRPLTTWESFERFGGYFASVGTLALGLLDFWRDKNRRLAHDRISNTVVVRRMRRNSKGDTT